MNTPLPAHGYFLLSKATYSMKVFSEEGRLFFDEKIGAGQRAITVKGLNENGIYVVSIRKNDEVLVTHRMVGY